MADDGPLPYTAEQLRVWTREVIDRARATQSESVAQRLEAIHTRHGPLTPLNPVDRDPDGSRGDRQRS